MARQLRSCAYGVRRSFHEVGNHASEREHWIQKMDVLGEVRHPWKIVPMDGQVLVHPTVFRHVEEVSRILECVVSDNSTRRPQMVMIHGADDLVRAEMRDSHCELINHIPKTRPLACHASCDIRHARALITLYLLDPRVSLRFAQRYS